MRALSVRQPWAELFMRGAKEPFDHPEYGRVNIEFRSGPTQIRERIYIYASATATDSERDEAERFGLDFNALPRGVIVGTVELVGCDDGDWYVKSPERLTQLRKPTRRPNPVWFYPFEEDTV